ncbi:MAG: NAD(P)-dependent oxidoreductase [Synechococcus sp.]
MMNRLLVTGASGFLGWNLCYVAQSSWSVFGTYFSHAVPLDGASVFKCDLTNPSELERLFEMLNPDAVIHAAAASKPNFCQANPEESFAINVSASVNIARLCGERQIPLAFTSTDLVFDGQNAPYTEDDSVCPINVYGEHKVIAEQKMLEVNPAISICRMPTMFGPPSPISPTFLQGVVKNLKEGTAMNLFVDEFRTPVSARAASQGLLLAIEKQFQGILNLGGKERVSRYEFGLLVADILQLSTEHIRPAKQADVSMLAPRSPDVSMDSSKAFDMGYRPLTLKEELTCLPDISLSQV